MLLPAPSMGKGSVRAGHEALPGPSIVDLINLSHHPGGNVHPLLSLVLRAQGQPGFPPLAALCLQIILKPLGQDVPAPAGNKGWTQLLTLTLERGRLHQKDEGKRCTRGSRVFLYLPSSGLVSSHYCWEKADLKIFR